MTWERNWFSHGTIHPSPQRAMVRILCSIWYLLKCRKVQKKIFWFILLSKWVNMDIEWKHGLWTPGEEIAFTAWQNTYSNFLIRPKHILSATSAQIFRCLLFVPSFPLFICTWILKFLVWKIKFDELKTEAFQFIFFNCL